MEKENSNSKGTFSLKGGEYRNLRVKRQPGHYGSREWAENSLGGEFQGEPTSSLIRSFEASKNWASRVQRPSSGRDLSMVMKQS